MKKTDLFFAFILLPIDIAMIIVAFIFAYSLRMNLEIVPAASSIPLKEYLRYSVYLLPIWTALFALNGLYYIKASTGFLNELYRIFSASSTAMLFLVVMIFFSKTLFFSRLILIFTWALSIIMLSLGRVLVKSVRRSFYRFGIGRRNIILIGDNGVSENIVSEIAKDQHSGYKILGVFNGSSNISKYGLKIIGSVDDLKEKMKQFEIDEVILTDYNMSKSKIMDIIQTCADNKVIFKYVPDILSLMTLNVSSELIGSMPAMELKSIPLDGWGRIVKRIGDFILSFVLLTLLSPVLLILAILVRITSKGPIIYSQPRIGRDEKPFFCHKFRSMYMQSCDFKGGSNWTTKDDDCKITSIGKILRKSNLDELPQLWNILKGDMSFIGPRPEQPKFVEKFEKEIPDYFRRHKVKAGLTGWAQVNGFKGDTSIKERVRYDMYYIENWSLWFDFKIILKTIGLLIYEIIGGKYEYRSRP